MLRLTLIVLTLVGTCTPTQSDAIPLRQSREPFWLNPRFCGAIGNACERQPVPC